MDTNVSTPKRSFLRRHPRALRWGAAAAAAAALTLALPINTASGQTTLSAQVTNSILSQLAAIQASINSLATKFDAFVSSFNTFVTSFNTYASGPTSLATSQGSGYAAVNAVRCNINNTASSTATMVLNVYNGSTAVYSSAFTIGSANTLSVTIGQTFGAPWCQLTSSQSLKDVRLNMLVISNNTPLANFEGR